jgi:subtilisin family serine protease
MTRASRFPLVIFLAFLVLTASGHFVVDAAAFDAPPILLRSRTIETDGDHPDVMGGLLALTRSASSTAPHLIVQLDATPDQDARAALARAGIVLQGSLGSHAFVARIDGDLRRETLAELPVRYLGALETADKVAPVVRERGVPEHARVAMNQVALYVEMHRDVDLEHGLAHLMQLVGARVVGRVRSLGGAVVLVDADDWPRVAACEQVKWIEPASPGLSTLNDGVREAMAVDTVREGPAGLTGAGVQVVLYDGGVVCPYHQDFEGRAILGESGPTSNHATHVAGTLLGGGVALAGRYRGVAPGAGLVSYAYPSCVPLCLYDNPQDLEENYADAIGEHGADFASNSIGSNVAANGYDCELEGDYENSARLIDAIARGSLGSPFASFWAAGNERGGSARCGLSYHTIGVPATAKNNIVVGATYSDTDSIASFSSFGPVDDGRMRPDVVAPGCEYGGLDGGISSTRNCASYTVMCGTSMSTPAVAGVAALMLERWRAVRIDDPTPLPSTFKAVLAAAAVDLGQPGPDYAYGYGKVDAEATVAVVDDGAVVISEIEQGGTVRLTLEVPDGLSALRAALAWDDVPGEPLTVKSLVNDLDLRLIAPGGTVYEAYVLDPASPWLPAVRGANRRDPSELVGVTEPAAGEWILEVAGFEVPEGPQSFSVAVNAPLADDLVAVPGNATPPPATAGPRLAQNVPNPFNPATSIRFTPAAGGGELTLRIFDAHGRLTRTLLDGPVAAEAESVVWDGRDDARRSVPSGIYFCELVQAGQRRVTRMVLTR